MPEPDKGSVSDTELEGKRLHAAFALELNRRIQDDERGVGIAADWDVLPGQDREAWQVVAGLVHKQAVEEFKEKLLGEAEALERPKQPGEDLTDATVRMVKAQGIREAVARPFPDHHEFELYSREDLEAERDRLIVARRKALSDGDSAALSRLRERLNLIGAALDTTSHKEERRGN